MEKKLIFGLACAAIALAPAPVTAGPLELAHVAKDSKWLVHLDCEALRRSKTGAYLFQNILQPKVDDMDAIKDMNLSINLTNIHSITLFGPTFQKDTDGVLMIRTTANVKKDLDTLCGVASLQGSDALKLAESRPFPVYKFKELLIAPEIDNTVIVAKSRQQLDRARDVLLGKGESLVKSSTFADYPKVTNTFFFLGMAEGFNENASIPPQAQVLKETTGGRLLIGEDRDKVFANLVFKGKNEESSLKIQQVFQGIVALASLTQSENQDLAELVKSTQISSEGQNVTLKVQFPVARAVEQLEEHVD